jgi:hypothetical protein
MKRGKNVDILSLITQTVSLIGCKLEIVGMELEHPQRFGQTGNRVVGPSLSLFPDTLIWVL